MSAHWQDDIDDMMDAYGQEVRLKPNEPSVTQQEVELRKQLITEEYVELMTAFREGNIIDISKEITDLLVVTIGAASMYGINLDVIWDIVHESNMTKANAEDDPVTGKRLKPKDYISPAEKILKALSTSGWEKLDD